jgi:hypothetical protein
VRVLTRGCYGFHLLSNGIHRLTRMSDGELNSAGVGVSVRSFVGMRLSVVSS